MKTLVSAIQLTPGVVYAVTIGARVNDSSDPTFAYRGEFCLLAKAEVGKQVHQVKWDEAAGVWRREVCFSDQPK